MYSLLLRVEGQRVEKAEDLNKLGPFGDTREEELLKSLSYGANFNGIIFFDIYLSFNYLMT